MLVFPLISRVLGPSNIGQIDTIESIMGLKLTDVAKVYVPNVDIETAVEYTNEIIKNTFKDLCPRMFKASRITIKVCNNRGKIKFGI